MPYFQTDPYGSCVVSFLYSVRVPKVQWLSSHVRWTSKPVFWTNQMAKSCWCCSPVISDWWTYLCWLFEAIDASNCHWLVDESRGVQPMRLRKKFCFIIYIYLDGFAKGGCLISVFISGVLVVNSSGLISLSVFQFALRILGPTCSKFPLVGWR